MNAPATIRPAIPGDAAVIAAMLARLGAEIGLPPAATEDTIRSHGFGPAARFSILIAEADMAIGFALYFPHFSTTLGQPGAYVQDLWTAPQTRGTGLGTRLLATVARTAGRDWGAAYLALSVYGQGSGAACFYARRGFEPVPGAQPLTLAGPGFAALTERTA